jgi:hypothetical protein
MHRGLMALSAPILAAALGCGDSLSVKNTSPRGSVGGIVVDAATRAPLAGVEVSLLAGGELFAPVVTEEDGLFGFDRVPAGVVLVSLAAPGGYQGTYLRGELPAAAGDFPTGNSTLTLGPVGLVPLDGSFSLRVLDANGRPVSGYAVTARHFVQWVDLTSGAGASRGEVVATVTTDNAGYALFSSFPDFFRLGPSVNDSLVVLLPPLDIDGDGIYDFSGGDRLFSARALGDPTPDVILDAGYTTTLQVRASTVAELAGAGGSTPAAAVIGSTDSIHVAFNLPIQDSVSVTVSDEWGAPLAGQPELTVRDDNLTLAFGQSPLSPGNEYNLHIHATAAVGARHVSGDFSAAFFTRALSSQVTIANVTRDPASQVVDLVFSEPIGLGGNANFTLNGANCVVYFEADLNQSGAVGDAPSELGAQSCNVALASQEPNPTGPPGLSGYTRYYRLTAPTIGIDATPLPAGTRMHLMFSHAANVTVRRPDGSAVGDFTGDAYVTLP